MSNPEIHKLLVLSTAHLTQATQQLYGDHTYANAYGLFIWTNDREDDEDMPEDMRAALAYSHGLGCTWVKYDGGVEALPCYEEAEGVEA